MKLVWFYRVSGIYFLGYAIIRFLVTADLSDMPYFIGSTLGSLTPGIILLWLGHKRINKIKKAKELKLSGSGDYENKLHTF